MEVKDDRAETVVRREGRLESLVDSWMGGGGTDDLDDEHAAPGTQPALNGGKKKKKHDAIVGCLWVTPKTPTWHYGTGSSC